jgi:hypothetical protein
MTSISSVASVYIPTTVSTPAPVATTPDTSSAPVASPATNANTQAPAVYTALANESASTIRGSNLNIST